MDKPVVEDIVLEAFGKTTSMVLRAAQLYVWWFTFETYLYCLQLQCSDAAGYQM